MKLAVKDSKALSATINEAALVSELKQDNALAFQTLYTAYSKRLYYFIYAHLKSKELAEELVHDVFVKVWEGRQQLNQNLSFSSYLFTISKNLVIDTIRKQSSEKLYQHYAQATLSNYSQATEFAIITADLEAICRQAIDQLPPKRKEIFNLSREEHLTYTEIAVRQGISVKTVESQMNKALKFLKKYLCKYADITTVLFLLLK